MANPKNPTFSHIWKECVSLTDAIYNILRYYPQRSSEVLTMSSELDEKLDKLLHIGNFRVVTVNPLNVENVKEIVKDQRALLEKDASRAREISGIVEIIARFMKRMKVGDTIDKDFLRAIDELRLSNDPEAGCRYSYSHLEELLKQSDNLSPKELQDPISLWTSFAVSLARQIAMLRETWATEKEVIQSMGELCRRLDRMKDLVDKGAMSDASYYPICTDFSGLCSDFRKTIEEQRKILRDYPVQAPQVTGRLECLMRLLYG